MAEQPVLPHVIMKPRVAPPRPKRGDPQCIRATAIKLTSTISGVPTAQQIEDVETDLEDADSEYADIYRALTNNHNWDGYELAKYLDEELGWEVDVSTVQDLDNAEHYRYTEHNARVEKWVIDYELTPKYAVGDIVTFKQESKSYEGTIRQIYVKQLRYVVEVPALGHNANSGTLGSVVEEEDLEKQTV